MEYISSIQYSTIVLYATPCYSAPTPHPNTHPNNPPPQHPPRHIAGRRGVNLAVRQDGVDILRRLPVLLRPGSGWIGAGGGGAGEGGGGAAGAEGRGGGRARVRGFGEWLCLYMVDIAMNGCVCLLELHIGIGDSA